MPHQVGTKVDVQPDLSAHRKVYSSLGTIVQLRFNPDMCSTELKVHCTSGNYENCTLTRNKCFNAQRDQPPYHDIKAIKDEVLRKARYGFEERSQDLIQRTIDEVSEAHMAESIALR